MLHGEGVPSISELMQEILLHAVLQPMQEILNSGYLGYLNDQIIKSTAEVGVIKNEARQKMQELVKGAVSIRPSENSMDDVVEEESPGWLSCFWQCLPNLPAKPLRELKSEQRWDWQSKKIPVCGFPL